MAGRFEDAVAELKIEAAQLGRSSDQAEARARAYREAGPGGYWRETLRQRQAGGDLGPGSDLDAASIYARLGDKRKRSPYLIVLCTTQHVADEPEGGSKI
jgi:hypothetical protein